MRSIADAMIFRSFVLAFAFAITQACAVHAANATITVSPLEADLGNIQAEVGRAYRSFTVANVGATEVRLGVDYGRGAGARACFVAGEWVFVLQPGQSCTLELGFGPGDGVIPNQPGPGSATVTLVANADEQRIPLTIRWNVVPVFLAIDASTQNLGSVTLGESVTATRLLRNAGPEPMTLELVVASWPSFSCTYLPGSAHIAHPTCYREHTLNHQRLQGTLLGCESLAPGASCSVQLDFAPGGDFGIEGYVEVFYQAGAEHYSRRWTVSATVVPRQSQSGTSLAVEYYRPLLQHFFVTALDAEKAALDAGAHDGWVRTGRSFWVYPGMTAAPAAAQPVCRYFGVPGVGPDSHFYSAIPSECDAVAALYPDTWQLETRDAFAAVLPDAGGNCPAGTSPLYRLWNQRANHRYTTDAVIPKEMAGWVREGYGAQGVAMCVPQ